ncbi:MAG TPA: TetR/AcrR family transcriptional regulator [Bryobacteraceae bacterium]|jgi:AcrR family transcriptional regulator|nr:TetR/AcrR family transcriptional regulator [Bryobacteraceae bacterium]
MPTRVLKRRNARLAERSPTWDGISLDGIPNGLTRERIVAAAIAIADEDGLAAVSIRRVASDLESSAMALYHYVPSKQDLLNMMLDATYGEFELAAEHVADWRAALHHFAWESRRCLQRHPWVNLLRTNDTEYGPQCIRALEALLTCLSRFGLDIRNAIRLMGVLFVFVNGFVAAEGVDQKRKRAKAQPQQPVFSKAVLATGKFPKVARFVEMGAELPDDQAFERALNWMLEGMASAVPSQIRPPNPANVNTKRSIARNQIG